MGGFNLIVEEIIHIGQKYRMYINPYKTILEEINQKNRSQLKTP